MPVVCATSIHMPSCGSGHHPGRVLTGVLALSIIIIIIRNYTIPDLSSKYTEFSGCLCSDEFSSYVVSAKPFSTSLVKPPWISVIIPLNEKSHNKNKYFT